MKNIFTIIIFVAGIYLSSANSQPTISPSVFNSAGTQFQTANGGMDMNIGEPLTTLISGNGEIITQGFLQPYNSIFNAKMFIQGYYTGSGTMNSVLMNEGVSANANAVDTVTISLVDPLIGTVVQTSKGVLQTNGSMTVTFPASVTGNYFYVYIQHRNSIETSSRHPILFSSTTSYDFSTGAAQAFGNNMAQVAPGVWAIYTGDINQDGYIDPYDFPPYDMDNSAQLTGAYKDAQGYSTDLNGDGYVDPYDFPVYDANNSKQVSAYLPW